MLKIFFIPLAWKFFQKATFLISLFNQSSTVTLLYKFWLCAGGRVSLLWYEWWIISKMKAAEVIMKKIKGCISVSKTAILTFNFFSAFLNKIIFTLTSSEESFSNIHIFVNSLSLVSTSSKFSAQILWHYSEMFSRIRSEWHLKISKSRTRVNWQDASIRLGNIYPSLLAVWIVNGSFIKHYTINLLILIGQKFKPLKFQKSKGINYCFLGWETLLKICLFYKFQKS